MLLFGSELTLEVSCFNHCILFYLGNLGEKIQLCEKVSFNQQIKHFLHLFENGFIYLKRVVRNLFLITY